VRRVERIVAVDDRGNISPIKAGGVHDVVGKLFGALRQHVKAQRALKFYVGECRKSFFLLKQRRGLVLYLLYHDRGS